jgi:hypothetical protein
MTRTLNLHVEVEQDVFHAFSRACLSNCISLDCAVAQMIAFYGEANDPIRSAHTEAAVSSNAQPFPRVRTRKAKP